MQFIKPVYIQRLLKLKTPEDIQEWREERKARFPTKLKRESIKLANELNYMNRDLDQRNKQSNKNHNSFNKYHKFNNQQNRFNKNGHKRSFNNSINQRHINEPKQKQSKISDVESKPDTGEQNIEEQSSDLVNLNESLSNDYEKDANQSDDLNNQANESEQNESSERKFNQFKRRRQPTLLEKMLLTDVKRNEEKIFECIELIVQNNYLSSD